MQIGSFNPVSILPGSTAATGKSDDAEKARQAALAAEQARAKAVSDAQEIPPQQDAAGVVRIASDGSTIPADLVYGNGSASTTDGSDVDTNEMAQRYSQAMERAAGNSTNLSVDSNGILLARPASNAEVKAQAFVHNAVTAMRDHADAQERLKAASAGDNTSTMQKLAARFKLFS
jgi:hypothetical protein